MAMNTMVYQVPLQVPDLESLGHRVNPCVNYIWSGWQDSNLRPLDPQSSALPDCATPRHGGPKLPNELTFCALLRQAEMPEGVMGGRE
jgi:hypothetical protein